MSTKIKGSVHHTEPFFLHDAFLKAAYPIGCLVCSQYKLIKPACIRPILKLSSYV